MLVGTIRTLEDLAGIGRQRTVADRCVHLRHDEVTTDLLLDSVSGDRIFLDRLSVDGTLTVRSCHIAELVIDHAQADAVLVVNSRIGRLTIRNASMGCDVTVTDTALDFLALHSCGAVRLERLRVEELVHINALRGPVRISNTHHLRRSVAVRPRTRRGRHPGAHPATRPFGPAASGERAALQRNRGTTQRSCPSLRPPRRRR
jgi:hypothetical protein